VNKFESGVKKTGYGQIAYFHVEAARLSANVLFLRFADEKTRAFSNWVI
jgi:hypothetical protein